MDSGVLLKTIFAQYSLMLQPFDIWPETEADTDLKGGSHIETLCRDTAEFSGHEFISWGQKDVGNIFFGRCFSSFWEKTDVGSCAPDIGKTAEPEWDQFSCPQHLPTSCGISLLIKTAVFTVLWFFFTNISVERLLLRTIFFCWLNYWFTNSDQLFMNKMLKLKVSTMNLYIVFEMKKDYWLY